jgi:hypothetical protein
MKKAKFSFKNVKVTRFNVKSSNEIRCPFSESIFYLNNKTVRSELMILYYKTFSIYIYFPKRVGFAESFSRSNR